MKAKIDKNGNLYLERAGELKKQTCPQFGSYINPNGQADISACGDWCPLFEIFEYETGQATIRLCKKNKKYDVYLTDERGK